MQESLSRPRRLDLRFFHCTDYFPERMATRSISSFWFGVFLFLRSLPKFGRGFIIMTFKSTAEALVVGIPYPQCDLCNGKMSAGKQRHALLQPDFFQIGDKAELSLIAQKGLQRALVDSERIGYRRHAKRRVHIVLMNVFLNTALFIQNLRLLILPQLFRQALIIALQIGEKLVHRQIVQRVAAGVIQRAGIAAVQQRMQHMGV